MFTTAEPFTWNVLNLFIQMKSLDSVPETMRITIRIQFTSSRTYTNSLGLSSKPTINNFRVYSDILTFQLFSCYPFLVCILSKHLRINLLNIFFIRFTWECWIPYFCNVMTLTPITEPSISHHLTDKPTVLLSSIQSCFFSILHNFSNIELNSEVLTILYLISNSKINRTEQNTLRNYTKFRQLHTLNLELLITQEFKVRVLRLFLNFLHCIFSFFICQILTDFMIFKQIIFYRQFTIKTIRKKRIDFNINSHITRIVFALLYNYCVVHNSCQFNSISTWNFTNFFNLYTVCQFLSIHFNSPLLPYKFYLLLLTK